MARIAIDVGHAFLTGARGNGLEEHEQSAIHARLLAGVLHQAGHDVDIIDFPEQSNSDDLNMTIVMINDGQYDLAISLHMDASTNPSARGGHVCYYSGRGKQLAAAVAEPLARWLPGRAGPLVRRPGLAILRRTVPPCILIEAGFITSAEDIAILRDHRAEVFASIGQAVTSWLSTHSKQ